jgi:phosphoglycerol transferase MdoB-like AlkP superfamily enzyme
MACYFLLFPLLLLLVSIVVSTERWLQPTLKAYTALLVIVVALLQAGDLAVYPEWHSKVSFKVLTHLAHPSEAILSATWGYTLIFVLEFTAQLVFGYWLYRWLLRNISLPPLRQFSETAKAVGLWLLLVFATLFGIRGTLRTFPINVSSAYFSKDPVLNDMAVNTPWNFMNNVLDNLNSLNTNVFAFYPLNEACATTQSLSTNGNANAVPLLFTNNRPNIVLLIMESWQADVIGTLGGIEGLTPYFDSLANNGVLFTNFYANAHTSDKGNAAILAGYPAFPLASVITQPSKYRSIPTINQPLKGEGYYSTYHYGGQLIYANIKGFLADHQFDEIVDINNLEDKWPTGKLGVHDEYMYQELHQHLNKLPEPFFSCLFTLSTHSPYDIPTVAGIDSGNEHQPYLNTIKYADESLRAFFNAIKNEPWYSNTVFVMVADHGHATPRFYPIHDAHRFRIPLLIYGDMIKPEYKGFQVDRIGSQIDIAATILYQLGLGHSQFTNSKNLLDTTQQQFAPYSFHNGIGWIRPDGDFGYELSSKAFYPDTLNKTHPLVKEGFSFFECRFQDFLDL